jgi:bacterial/archaeal transporter family-2 protein
MPIRLVVLFLAGIGAGSAIAVQVALNAALGKRTGDLGSVLILTLVSILVVLPLTLLFPGTANLRGLPGPDQWYLYAGGILGVVVVTAPIILVPRIGATATLTALVVGQLAVAVAIDHFGLLGVPSSPITVTRAVGILILVTGTLLIVKR